MLKAFFCSKQWAWWAWGVGAAIVLMVLANVWLEIRMNRWLRVFYDILDKRQEHTIDEFNWQLVIFSMLAAGFIIIGVVNLLVTQHYTFRWRTAMTEYYFERWRNIHGQIEGEAQRIQEDCRDFGGFIESYAEQVINMSIILPIFILLLYGVGEEVDLTWVADKYPFSAPIVLGPWALTRIALLITAVATVIGIFIGRRLPGLQLQNQVVEADFRRWTELAANNKPSVPELIAEFSKQFALRFIGVRGNYFRLYKETAKFQLFRICFIQVMIILPFLLIAPSLFAGVITWGIMRQAADIFDTVRSKFSFVIDNWRGFSQLISIIKRLREFDKKIDLQLKAEQSENKTQPEFSLLTAE